LPADNGTMRRDTHTTTNRKVSYMITFSDENKKQELGPLMLQALMPFDGEEFRVDQEDAADCRSLIEALPETLRHLVHFYDHERAAEGLVPTPEYVSHSVFRIQAIEEILERQEAGEFELSEDDNQLLESERSILEQNLIVDHIRLVRRIVNRYASAEDANTKECLLSMGADKVLHCARKGFDETKGTFVTYLVMALRNMIFDVQSRTRTGRWEITMTGLQKTWGDISFPGQDIMEEVADHRPGPATGAMKAELSEALGSVLSNLHEVLDSSEETIFRSHLGLPGGLGGEDVSMSFDLISDVMGYSSPGVRKMFDGACQKMRCKLTTVKHADESSFFDKFIN